MPSKKRPSIARGPVTRQIASCLAYLFCVSVLCGATGARPTGANCELSDPPQNAGEDIDHGFVVRVFPRAKDIGADYNGCQTLWVSEKDKWLILSVVEFDHGDPIRFWSTGDVGAPNQACVYKLGQLVSGNADQCPSPHVLLHRSFAPSCTEKIRASVERNGIDARQPKGSQYE